jgi:hypothetical protein
LEYLLSLIEGHSDVPGHLTEKDIA